MSLPKDYVDELNVLNQKVLREQPTNVIQFCADYFNRRLKEQKTNHREDTGSPGDIPTSTRTSFTAPVFNTNSFKQPFVSEEAKDDVCPLASDSGRGSKIARTDYVPQGFNVGRRSSVSAESLAPDVNKQAEESVLKPRAAENWSPEQLARLKQSVAGNFLFANLDDDERDIVLGSLQERTFEKGSYIIKQGDEGDYFYVVESGSVNYYKDNEFVNSSGAGSSFGELALMYNAPRAASVVANSDCVLWALDRLTFKRIVLDTTSRKRQKYEKFLREVPVLSSLNSYELSRIADALDSEVYEPGQAVIREGDHGDNFYLIESGTAEVTRKDQGKVKELKEGDYFGEVALLNDLPRQATVSASNKLRVATLGKSGFQRLLGKQVVDILTQQDPTRL
uniref:cAMP-dependent protein kinase regulatory subunit n=1 Tax=Blastobotrys adeninivorans TaxID=409370 RepID=A0A060T9H9_BLAAD